jgi:glycopeptide antibiotics resistance protein
MSARWLLTTVTCLLAGLLLLAIAICSLAPSPNMREMWWIPDWLGTWADRNGNFRNFPVFAVFAALLFFVFRFFRLPTANRILPTALRAAVCVSALGVVLEALQLLLPNRHADPMDLLWMTLGAFFGAAIAAACFRLLNTGN